MTNLSLSSIQTTISNGTNDGKLSLEEYLSSILTKMLTKEDNDPVSLFAQLSNQMSYGGGVDDMISCTKRPVNPYPNLAPRRNEFTGIKLPKEQDSIDWTKKLSFLINPPPPERKPKKINEDGEEEEDEEEENPDEEEEEEVSVPSGVYDFLSDVKLMNIAGIGLSDVETHSLMISMFRLKENDSKTKKVFLSMRFWGKIFGTNNNYYIIEVEEEPREEEQPEKDEEEQEDPEEEQEEVQEEILKNKSIVPAETRVVDSPVHSAGANRYVYYVATKLPSMITNWVKLPDVTPESILQARMIKKAFTGNLRAPIFSHPPFRGDESMYLRAQIARITSSTKLAPKDYYTFEEEQVEEEEEDEEGNPIKKTDHLIKPYSEIPAIRKNEEFNPRKCDIEQLSEWLHIEPYILHSQGRCSLYTPEEEEEEPEEEEDEEEEEGLKKKETPIERIPPLLSSISLDDYQTPPRVGCKSWVLKTHLNSLRDYHPLASRHVSLRSVRWPGAFTVAERVPESGVKFCNVYIGSGAKEYNGKDFETYTPPFAHPVQDEYKIDPHELEQIDSYEARFVHVDQKTKKENNKKEQLSILRLKKNTVILGREFIDVTSPEQLAQYEEPPPPVEEVDDNLDEEEEE